MQEPYGVDLSPDASLSGSVGNVVVHTLTITNTGLMTDTFDLNVSGQTWITNLPTAAVNLAPSTSGVFTVAVSIPPDAADQAIDSVTITAT